MEKELFNRELEVPSRFMSKCTQVGVVCLKEKALSCIKTKAAQAGRDEAVEQGFVQ